MEKIILLTAVCLCGCCVILFFLSVKYTLFRIYAFILWSLSAVMIFSAAAIMIAYQVLSKFEYQYVYSHTGLDTAVIYKVSSLWSGQEGSFLTWALIMSVMSFFLLRIKGKDKYRAFGIYSIICFCIYMICFISRPFAKMSFIPADGMGLNEALKDPWMVVHPPLIFISYSAMAILFSLSANLSKKAVDDIADRIRFWLRISWFFLGIGILSGSIWAYRTLGWGGYWSWDPIENAAFIPWLVICGYFHRNEYNKQSVCVVPFSIAAFGVFLARSGILKNRSMHAYTDGNLLITVIILCFIIGIALFLVLSERKKKKAEQVKKNFSYKRLIPYIFNGYAALIFLGTVASFIINTEIPAVYYNFISIIFALVYSILLLIRNFEWLKKRNILMIILSTILVIGIMMLCGSVNFMWLLLIWICLMPLSLWIVSGFLTESLKFYMPHLGVLLMIVGVITSTALSKKNFYAAHLENNNIIIADIVIPIEKILEKDTLIIVRPQADLIIQCSGITYYSQGNVIVPYFKKPLILLFWVGSFIVVAQPCAVIITKRLKTVINKSDSG